MQWRLVLVALAALACNTTESRTLGGDDATTGEVASGGQGFHVAPNGSPHGDGSANAPWDLATALNQPAAVQPGDTIWLHGGVYEGRFNSRLSGTSEHPVVLRQAPGERATIDGSLNVGGEAAIYWGFEVRNSDSARPDQPGVNVRAPQTRFVNMVVHDHGGNGFGLWAESPDAEIYGSIIYNNGSIAESGEIVGQGIAAQNRDGGKRIADNVLFNQFAHGIHIYGSDAAALRNFHIEGNASFNSGLGTPDGARPDLLVGGGSAAEDIVVNANYTYRTDKGTTAVFGNEWGPTNGELVLTDNVLIGNTKVITWRTITAMRNTFAGAETLMMLRVPADAPASPDYEWADNTYIAAEGQWQPFNLFRGQVSAGGFFLPEWQQATGLDRGSRYARGRPVGVHVFVRPNQYEEGRAHIVVYNWDRRPSVTADVGEVLRRGMRYEVRRAQDFFGAPVLGGTYDGRPITIPMTAAPAPKPVGRDAASAPTGPDFDVFVLMPVTPPPTPQP